MFLSLQLAAGLAVLVNLNTYRYVAKLTQYHSRKRRADSGHYLSLDEAADQLATDRYGSGLYLGLYARLVGHRRLVLLAGSPAAVR